MWLDNSDGNSVYDNLFANISGFLAYDDAAVIIGSDNNTISDNLIDNVGVAFAFLPTNNPNYNSNRNTKIINRNYFNTSLELYIISISSSEVGKKILLDLQYCQIKVVEQGALFVP